MTDLSLGNLITYSAQVLLVVCAGAIGAHLVRLPIARARLTYWRLIVVACLILPLFPARTADVVFGPPFELEAASVTTMEALELEVEPVPWRLSLWSAPLWVLLAGAAGRASWIALGLLALARLRRRSDSAWLDEEVDVLRRAIAPGAELRWHDRIAQPVTFGWRRPVVLLPRRVADLPLDAQRAVVCHELLHVARRDWAWLLVEEAIQCAFWFHPAMWWALAQVQLGREQTVDEAVVRITAARQPYMSALVMFAGEPTAPAPAIPFIRRRHLASRIEQLSQEHAMSRLRIACAAAALVAVVGMSSWAAVSALPLQARDITPLMFPSPPAGVTSVAQPVLRHLPATPGEPIVVHGAVTPDAQIVAERIELNVRVQAQPVIRPVPRATERVAPEYPLEAVPHGVEAVVTLHVTVSTIGQVTDLAVVKTRLTTERDIDSPAYWASQPLRAFALAAESAARRWVFDPPDEQTTVELAFVFVPQQRTAAYAIGRPGGTRVSLPSELPLPQPTPSAGSAVAQPGAGVVGSATPGIVPLQPAPTGAAAAPTRIRVGSEVRQPTKIFDARPEYPPVAKAARVTGVVILEAVIATDGSVSETTVLRSIPLLDQSAVDALRQWKFTQTLLNGQPVEVVMVVTINFTLPPE